MKHRFVAALLLVLLFGSLLSPMTPQVAAQSEDCPTFGNYGTYQRFHGEIVDSHGNPLPQGTTVRAYSPRDELVGCGSLLNAPGLLAFMHVYGDMDWENFKGMRSGEVVIFRANGRTLTYREAAPRWQPAIGAFVKVALSYPEGVVNTLNLMIVYGHIFGDDGKPAPIGTRVQMVTPRGDIAGEMVTTYTGNFGASYVYGEDNSLPDFPLPGFRPGEDVQYLVNGVPTISSPNTSWRNDWDRSYYAVIGNAPAVPITVSGNATTITLTADLSRYYPRGGFVLGNGKLDYRNGETRYTYYGKWEVTENPNIYSLTATLPLTARQIWLPKEGPATTWRSESLNWSVKGTGAERKYLVYEPLVVK